MKGRRSKNAKQRTASQFLGRKRLLHSVSNGLMETLAMDALAIDYLSISKATPSLYIYLLLNFSLTQISRESIDPVSAVVSVSRRRQD